MHDTKTHLTISVQSKDVICHPESFYNTMFFVIDVAQCFGIMPLYGITEKAYHKIEKLIRFLYKIVSVSGTLLRYFVAYSLQGWDQYWEKQLLCPSTFAIFWYFILREGRS